MTEPFFIVVEGNIGVGKTSLATTLANRWKGDVLLEEFEENEFLSEFYIDPEAVSLQTELRFLLDRYAQLNQHLLENRLIVADYFIEKSLIFAENTLKPRDFKLFREMYWIMFEKIRKPDLYVYLNADVQRLRSNILKRDRKMERNITDEYLDQVNKGYLKYVAAHKSLNSLVIDISKYDFVKYPEHLSEIEEMILAALPHTASENSHLR